MCVLCKYHARHEHLVDSTTEPLAPQYANRKIRRLSLLPKVSDVLAEGCLRNIPRRPRADHAHRHDLCRSSRRTWEGRDRSYLWKLPLPGTRSVAASEPLSLGGHNR